MVGDRVATADNGEYALLCLRASGRRGDCSILTSALRISGGCMSGVKRGFLVIKRGPMFLRVGLCKFRICPVSGLSGSGIVPSYAYLEWLWLRVESRDHGIVL